MKKSMSRQDKLEMLDAVLDKAGTENEPVVKRFTERLHRLVYIQSVTDLLMMETHEGWVHMNPMKVVLKVQVGLTPAY